MDPKERVQGLRLRIEHIPKSADNWDVIRAVAKALHSDDFPGVLEDGRLLNFKVQLNESQTTGFQHDGSASLTIGDDAMGRKVLQFFKERPLKVKGQKVRVYPKGKPYVSEAMRLQRTPYTDPDIEQEFQTIDRELREELRLDVVQFGVLYTAKYPTNKSEPPSLRSYSIEWQKDYRQKSAAWLKFEYSHKLIRITLGDRTTEEYGTTIAVSFSNIIRVAVGYESGEAYAIFDTITPPVFEQIQFNRPLTGNDRLDNQKYKTRIGYLDDAHKAVSAYAQKLRILLYSSPAAGHDIIEEFTKLCTTAGISRSAIIRLDWPKAIQAARLGFFSSRVLHNVRQRIRQFDWDVAFQLELLLCNALLTTHELNDLMSKIEELSSQGASQTEIGALLRVYATKLPTRPPRVSPLLCFQLTKAKFEYKETKIHPGQILCCHVTFTPTRMVLEGPYTTQSNRILRLYKDFQEHFIRADFRDEDRLSYHWDREVDGSTFVHQRVGGILKNGFSLAGRQFEFLAYSSSALREHSVWFVNPFYADVEDPVTKMTTRVHVTGEYIRQSVGDFENMEWDPLSDDKPPLIYLPSKFAARLSQAFTATDPSVEIREDNWEEVPDIECHPYCFTDGIGTISQELARRIWEKLCETRRGGTRGSIAPSAYQIRFLGYKGVVSVDKELNHDSNSIMMRLRPSMRKFDVKDKSRAPIEIAGAFEKPNQSHFNRPLVMFLEGSKVERAAFEKHQQLAIASAQLIDNSLTNFYEVLDLHGLGNVFRLPSILRKLQKGYSLDLSISPGRSIDTPFLKQLRQVARTDILRGIKHDARIPIDGSWLLVGVADEGPAYIRRGYQNVFVLEEGKIFACVQLAEDEEPEYLEGPCTISRSPVVHPGDIQHVYAIGKPPEGMMCLFSHLKNVVVFSTVGKRSLPSQLGGGDLDGDLYDIIMDPTLLPPIHNKPASYSEVKTRVLDRPSTVDDICDFIVDYINSDVLGLLSDRLLVIADQSLDGIYDKDCLKLAKLCSQAVDFPKQGIPVDLDSEEQKLPSTLIRCKPDWHAAEVVSPRKTDYYLSTRALGYMYRAIAIEDPDDINQELRTRREAASKHKILADPISAALSTHVEQHVSLVVLDNGLEASVRTAFRKYTEELRYICMTHTVTNTPGVYLLEAEVVVGTILAKCTQKRWRKERKWRMRTHADTLVRNLQLDLDPDNRHDAAALERAWCAWNYSLRHQDEFGANSFGLVALGVLLDCLERMK